MTPDEVFDALGATWPAAHQEFLPPFVIRDGQGGGKRVSAATATGPVGLGDITTAERAMAALGQPALFSLRGEEDPLDRVLAQLGYGILDPTLIRACKIEVLTAPALSPVSAFAIWEPLQIIRDIWTEAGIDAARIAVMNRVTGPRTALLARSNDRPAGAGFAAVYGDIAMVHALEVKAQFRRKGAGRNMMLAAARWAASQGARHMAVAVVHANAGANALYTSLGMPVCARYHYRQKD